MESLWTGGLGIFGGGTGEKMHEMAVFIGDLTFCPSLSAFRYRDRRGSRGRWFLFSAKGNQEKGWETGLSPFHDCGEFVHSNDVFAH